MIESEVLDFNHQETVGKLKLSNVESKYYAALMNISCAETDELETSEINHKVHVQKMRVSELVLVVISKTPRNFM